MRLVKVRNVYDVLRIIFWLQWLTFSLPRYAIRTGKNVVIKHRTIGAELFFSHVMIGILALDESLTPSVFSRRLRKILAWVNVFFLAACHLVNGYELHRKTHIMKSIFDKLKNLDNLIQLEKPQLNTFKNELTLCIVSIISTHVVTCGIAFSKDTADYTAAFFLILAGKMRLEPFTHLMVFIFIIHLTKYYLEWIDRQLVKFKLHYDQDESQCTPFVTFRSHYMETKGCKMAIKVERIRKIYGLIHDLKEEINEAFSLRLCMDIMSAVVQTLLYLYQSLSSQNPLNESMSKAMEILSLNEALHWIAFLALKFWLSVRICGKVARCDRNIGVTVHQITSASYCDNVRNELTTFSLELLHRDPHIKAFGLFVIDYPLIGSVAHGLIMQLIALFQFNLPGSSRPPPPGHEQLATPPSTLDVSTPAALK